MIHGNDWVDTEQFAELIERLQKEEADVVLCRGSYADYEKSLLEEIADYDMLMDGSQYRFEDLLYPGYPQQYTEQRNLRASRNSVHRVRRALTGSGRLSVSGKLIPSDIMI